MNIDFINETEFSLTSDFMAELERISNLTLETEKICLECEISLTIVSNDEIKKINKKFRKIDSSTDVLSFPCYALESGNYSSLTYESTPVMLGDIIISYEKAISQANEYGHSLIREFAFLTVHSILHLLGYDHTSNEEKEIMFSKQEAVLQKGGILR